MNMINLESSSMILKFRGDKGLLCSLLNRETGETYRVDETGFLVEGIEFQCGLESMKLSETETEESSLRFRYECTQATVEVTWTLGPDRHFAEKRVIFVPKADYSLQRVRVTSFTVEDTGIELVCVKHPTFERLDALHPQLKREPDTEPVKTWFGRTQNGGFFTGLEMPFDKSQIEDGNLDLSFAPNLRLKRGERFECEPAYLGVYRRGMHDADASQWKPKHNIGLGVDQGGFDGAAAAGLKQNKSAQEFRNGTVRETAVLLLPLPSESAAMTAMTSQILGPPRHGFKALACGWHCEMEQDEYTRESLDGDIKSLEFIKECGLDGVSDSHPWGGETDKMKGLREEDCYSPGQKVRKFLKRAQELGLMVVQWPTMNNTHPWKLKGGPFRQDRPEWLRGVEGETRGGLADVATLSNADNYRRRLANCLACNPFYTWLEKVIKQAMNTDYYGGWCMDGDFWGTGAYYNTIVPVSCLADNHDHLAGDSNYGCQRALDRLVRMVRQEYPQTYIVMCRPPMDLGVWSNRNVDACFTLVESGTGNCNIAAGDEIRLYSRIRVHHHFFPHWLDWSLLFPSYSGYAYYADDPAKRPQWPLANIDYVLLSALSCSPNLLFYLPTKTGIPEKDKSEIRKWLNWGRRNERFLMVRKDLFNWPDSDQVDGSAHIDGNEGLIFLFNSSQEERLAKFAVNEAEIGWKNKGKVVVEQEYPLNEKKPKRINSGETIEWPVAAESAAFLRIKNAG